MNHHPAPSPTTSDPPHATWRQCEPFTYEHDSNQCQPTTATVWTAHLPVTDASRIPDLLAALAGHPALTGEYLHTASYTAWSEPDKTGDADPDHLAIYYAAATEDDALGTALTLLTLLWPTHRTRAQTTITCAGDWEWDTTLTLT